MGGLGNQLFIYGAGLALARHLHSPLRVNCSWFSYQNLRTLELDLLGPDPDIDFYSARASVYSRGVSRARRILFDSDGIFREPASFLFTTDFWKVKPGTTLNGFFQSWKYLEPSASEIRLKVLTPSEPSEWFMSTLKHLGDLGNWTSIHVRRGDYLTPVNSQYHGIVERSYYEKATRMIQSLEGHNNFVIFSDDLPAARHLVDEIPGHFTFIKPPPSSPAIETMRLMALAHSSVIANSSYSWWGAWLTDHQYKTVIAPRPWFDNPTTHARDLLPPHWVTIGR